MRRKHNVGVPDLVGAFETSAGAFGSDVSCLCILFGRHPEGSGLLLHRVTKRPKRAGCVHHHVFLSAAWYWFQIAGCLTSNGIRYLCLGSLIFDSAAAHAWRRIYQGRRRIQF